jgi:pimeloyl-ACP methyl ester carboxylesterase
MMNRNIFIGGAFAISVATAVSCRPDSKEINTTTSAHDTIVDHEEKSKSDEHMSYVISKDSTQIAFEKSGSGAALIIVSGALSARNLLDGEPRLLIEKLSRHFTVYVYDRRGRGESTDEQPYAVGREIEDLESLINDAAGGQAYLYGVSSGAALSLHAAAKLGSAKVLKLAIFEPPFGQERQAFEKQKQGVHERVSNGKPGDAAAFFLSEIGIPPQVLAGMKASPAWKTIEEIDFTLVYDYQVLGDGAIPQEVVKAINVPTLVMHGEKSMDFMHATAEQLARLIPDAQHKTLKGQMHQAKAEVVTPLLIDFFNR